jgi:hypothetical protein
MHVFRTLRIKRNQTLQRSLDIHGFLRKEQTRFRRVRVRVNETQNG